MSPPQTPEQRRERRLQALAAGSAELVQLAEKVGAVAQQIHDFKDAVADKIDGVAKLVVMKFEVLDTRISTLERNSIDMQHEIGEVQAQNAKLDKDLTAHLKVTAERERAQRNRKPSRWSVAVGVAMLGLASWSLYELVMLGKSDALQNQRLANLNIVSPERFAELEGTVQELRAATGVVQDAATAVQGEAKALQAIKKAPATTLKPNINVTVPPPQVIIRTDEGQHVLQPPPGGKRAGPRK